MMILFVFFLFYKACFKQALFHARLKQKQNIMDKNKETKKQTQTQTTS